MKGGRRFWARVWEFWNFEGRWDWIGLGHRRDDVLRLKLGILTGNLGVLK